MKTAALLFFITISSLASTSFGLDCFKVLGDQKIMMAGKARLDTGADWVCLFTGRENAGIESEGGGLVFGDSHSQIIRFGAQVSQARCGATESCYSVQTIPDHLTNSFILTLKTKTNDSYSSDARGLSLQSGTLNVNDQSFQVLKMTAAPEAYYRQ